MRPRASWAVAVLAALLLGGCAASASATAAEPARATLHLSEFAYTPATLELPAGRAITLTVVNDGVVDHDLVISELGGQLVRVRGGKSATISLKPLRAGTYRMLCSIPTHSDLGMIGTIVAR